MILLINICKDKLHYYEFVKPIEEILRDKGIKFFSKHYRELKDGDLKNAKKIIICGTSLGDNEFVKDINYFLWIKDYKKPILGICGGMQIIGLVFELDKQVKQLDIKSSFKHILKKKTEIGFYTENFNKEFLGLSGEQEVYHLHNNHVKFGNEFIEYTDSLINQVVKHKEKEIYGVLFHPEVRQKRLLGYFFGF
jgi:GMP synthase-like glutamine amidotransferase